MKNDLEYIVQEETSLLPFLLECLRGKSRNYAKGVLTRGQVRIDGRKCTDHARALRPGQKVTILALAPVKKQKLPFSIIYEDDELIAVNKPAGMLSMATDKEREKTAYHIVYDYIKQQSKSGRIFIVHRLDRETSGVLIFAKNEPLKRELQDNWDELTVRRCYTAIVEGIPDPSKGTVTSWLKQTKTLLVYSSERDGDGKLAVTNYRTVKVSDKYALVDIDLETGRKNQIRVHMHDIGCPVAGDKKYGAKTNPLNRLALHAGELVIKHPDTGTELKFTAPISGVFEKLFDPE